MNSLDSSTALKKIGKRIRLLDILSQDDVFISYSRRDGALYAAGVADKLTERGLSCFIDKLGTEPDHDLPDSLKQKITNCTVFVLIGTPAAKDSEFVGKEITVFKKTGRTILPIDFDGSVGKARWYSEIPGIATEAEKNSDALNTGTPSPNVISFVEKSFRYTKRNQRMFRIFWTTLSIVLILMGASVIASVFAWNQSKAAAEAFQEAQAQNQRAEQEKARAERETQNANEAARIADIAQKTAEEQTKKADDATKLSNEKTKEAALATELARVKGLEAQKATKLAAEKTRLAEIAENKAIEAGERQKTAENNAISLEDASSAANQLSFDPETSVTLAAKAYGRSANSFAENALRRALFESHIQAVMRGHENFVWDAAFDQTGDLVVTASRDGTARIWDARNGNQKVELKGQGDLLDVSISPNGKYVAAANGDQENIALLWDWQNDFSRQNPRLLRAEISDSESQIVCTAECQVRTVDFSPDSRYVATAGDQGIVWIWETATGILKESLPTVNNPISTVRFSRNGEYVLSSGIDGQVRLWKWQARLDETNPRLLPHSGPVETAVFGGKNDEFILTTTNKHVQGDSFVRTEAGEAWIWETFSPATEPIARLKGHTGALKDAQFDSAANFVVTASDDGTARVWNWRKNELLTAPMILRGHTDGLSSASFSPDGEYVVTSSSDGTARVWKPATRREYAEQTRQSVEVPSLAVLRGHTSAVWKAVYSPKGNYIATVSEDRTARIWSANFENSAATLPKHPLGIQSAAFNPADDNLVVTASRGLNPLRIWNWRDENAAEPLASLQTSENTALTDPCFSPDGNYIAAASRNWENAHNSSIAIWNWRSDESRRNPIILSGHTNNINSINFSNGDGQYIVTAGGAHLASGAADNTIRIWDWRNQQSREKPIILAGHTAPVMSAVFSRDNKWIVSGSQDGTVRVWNWRSESERQKPIVLRGLTTYPFYQVAISADNRYIAAVAGPPFAMVWEWESEEQQRNPIFLRGHSAKLNDIKFSPVGNLILSTSEDGTVRLWDGRTGIQLSIISGQPALSGKASFNSTGNLILVPGDKTANIYRCDECASANNLLRLAPQRVSPESRRLFSTLFDTSGLLSTLITKRSTDPFH